MKSRGGERGLMRDLNQAVHSSSGMFVAQFAVRNLRSEDPLWACLRWLGRGDRLDGMDGDLSNACLCWCGLEFRKC